MITWKFACIGTGHGVVPNDGEYFGSVIQDQFVWHLYKLWDKKK